MTRLRSYLLPAPDIARLKQAGNIPALVRHLNNTDLSVRWRAAEALGECGQPAVPQLIDALHSRSPPVRLGAIEALGAIRDPRAVRPLLAVTGHDRHLEIRWAAILSLGEIGSSDAIPFLVQLLRDPDRYLRLGAAITLNRLGWHPKDEADTIFLDIARQDWEEVRRHGTAATPCLTEIFRHTDPATREQIVSVLFSIGDTKAHAICQAALRDKSPRVRWRAVLASLNCGLASHDLPPMVAGRERTGPDPVAAAILNFLFLGIGYNYIGKWWGFPVFMTYVTVLALAQFFTGGSFLPYLVAYPVTAVLGIHTYYLAERMSDL